MKHGLVDESTDNNDTNIAGKPLYHFASKLKDLKTHVNTNGELLQNRTEKQIMPSKTTVNWLFNNIWCYLFIACFDCKIDVFQQTVVRVYISLILVCLTVNIAQSYLILHFGINCISSVVILGFPRLILIYFLVSCCYWLFSFYSVNLSLFLGKVNYLLLVLLG